MEKFPTSSEQPEDSFPEVNPWVGSPEHFEQAKANAAAKSSHGDEWYGTPEHFEQAKAQNKSNGTVDWDGLAKWREEQGPAPWNDPRWQTPPGDYETTRPNAIAHALQDYATEDKPNGAHQRVTRKQLDPAVVGMFTAAAFMAVEILGIGDNPSDLILNNYAAATTLLASGAAATGALAGKLTADYNTKEKLDSAQHIKEKERNAK